jgi:poly(A) polymerase
MAALLDNVPQSRMFDEMIKLLQTGHSLPASRAAQAGPAPRGVPDPRRVLDEAHRHDGARSSCSSRWPTPTAAWREQGRGRRASCSACMLWHDVLDRWQKLRRQGEPPFPALQQAIDAVFDARIGDISGRGKLAADMREIWMMQPRFERASATARSRCRAAALPCRLDFLRLRGDAGEAPAELAEWWEDFSLGTPKSASACDGVDEEHEGAAPRSRRARAGGSARPARNRPQPAQAARRRQATGAARSRHRRPATPVRRAAGAMASVVAFVGLGANLGVPAPRSGGARSARPSSADACCAPPRSTARAPDRRAGPTY